MKFSLSKRVPSQEILDSGVSAAEAEESLLDIEWAHRYLGGGTVVRRGFMGFLRDLRQSRLSLLDLGCGSGHAGRDLASALTRSGIDARVFGVDRLLAHARLAARGSVIGADAFSLPFPDGAFDVVFSTLFLHHFSPEEIDRLLRESARVARAGVAAFDLRRSYTALGVVTIAGSLFFKSSISVADGKASVRQAYREEELAAIAGRVLPGSRVDQVGPLALRILWRK
jgi:SAM-dependent methyltransferase